MHKLYIPEGMGTGFLSTSTCRDKQRPVQRTPTA